jgi:fructose-bisphosphate aldolase class II
MMPLVTSKPLLEHARANHYAVGAFNATNLETVQAIIEAAEAEAAPVIIQISEGAMRYGGLRYLAAIVRAGAADATVPVVLHLDHGSGFEVNMRCLQAGFTSLMYDGSAKPFEENVATTALIVRAAHACGIPVEAELGQVFRVGDAVTAADIQQALTDPDKAAEFVRLTGCDSLAVAVGSVHGMRSQEAQLDQERIRQCALKAGVPLVLHGSSGVPDDAIRAAIENGICKVNVSTAIGAAFCSRLRGQCAESTQEHDIRKLLGPAREEAKERVRQKLRLFGSSGKAGAALDACRTMCSS